MKYIVCISLMFSFSAFGAAGKNMTVACKVGSFDAKMVKLNCDSRGDFFMKTPRKWLPKKIKLNPGKVVKFPVDANFMKKWNNLNKKSHTQYIKKLKLAKAKKKKQTTR